MVTILTGISGSGKSTYAQKNASENTVVINRDNIRRELTGEESLSEYFASGMDRFLEEQVTKIEHQRLAFTLSQGKDVIIDNTNLEKRFVKEYLKIAIDFGLNIHQINVQAFPIDIDDAYQRVCERDKTPIAYKVLKNQLARFLNGWDLTKLYTEVLETHEPKKWYFPKFPIEQAESNPDLPPIIICDLDGTLSHRAVLKFPKPHMRSYYDTIEYSTDEPDAFLAPILTALMEKRRRENAQKD